MTLLRRSLVAKLLVAFATTVLVGIGFVAVLANLRTTAEFESYLTMGQRMAAQHLAESVVETYGRTGSWDAVAQALTTQARGPRRRVVIADLSGRVVVDTDGRWLGRTASSLNLDPGATVRVRGEDIGTLYLPSFDPTEHEIDGLMGHMGTGSPMAGAHAPLAEAESAFLARVNQSLVIAAAAATALALALGGLLGQRIVGPLRELARGAQRIAQGHLDERIGIQAEDEVGQLARAFNQMAESLERNERARRQLVADVAHELRTPLTVIGGTVRAMRDGVLSADEDNLRSIQEEVDALARLVADLRDLSLGDAGQFSLERRSMEIASLLDQVVAGFTAEAKAQQVAIEVEASSSLPALEVDEARLIQAMRNLLTNALRHTPSGGRVTVRAVYDGDAVEIQVSDTGGGIAPEHLPHVFERFYRADPSRARQSGGMGLGLAITQQIVRAHGGVIRAESPGTGQGATFTMRLPVTAGGLRGETHRLPPQVAR